MGSGFKISTALTMTSQADIVPAGRAASLMYYCLMDGASTSQSPGDRFQALLHAVLPPVAVQTEKTDRAEEKRAETPRQRRRTPEKRRAKAGETPCQRR